MVNDNTSHNEIILYKHIDMIRSVWPSVSESALQNFPSFATVYTEVLGFGVPNFLGAQVPISSGLIVEQWEQALQAYHDNQICKFLKYGWPIGFLADLPPESVTVNHPSAIQHERHINQFIEVELKHKAIVGPFSEPPFQPWTRCSPLMTRPKKNSDLRRVIVDLSYPQGRDVNSGINIKSYLGQDITFTLPTITDLTAKLQLDGPGAFMWKADLSRAYRQLRIDPLDAPLTGIRFKGDYYIDLCPPFGCRSSSAACQRVSNAVAYIMGQAGFLVLAYLDDYGASEPTNERASQSYHHFRTVAKSLGLQLAEEKCVPPTQQIEWLGHEIDSTKMTVAIPAKKLQEVLKECELWLSKKRVKKGMIQSLLGKLIHISNCVVQARKFVARIIQTLRDMGQREWTTVNEPFIKDVRWFLEFARISNGIRYIRPHSQVFIIECDSCLEAGGGVAHGFAYTWKYPQQVKDRYTAIHELEAINLVVAYLTFASLCTDVNTIITIFTDNMAGSYALQTGRTRDPTLGACARELWLAAAVNHHSISIKHKPGNEIELADALSRMFIDPLKQQFVNDQIAQNKITMIDPVVIDFKFFDALI